MKFLGRVISSIGLLISVLSFCSLLYVGFSQPLEPYFRGVAGEMIEYYRNLRDLAFGGLGIILSRIIEWLRTIAWASWLPMAPWFVLPNLIKDILTLYILVGGATNWHYQPEGYNPDAVKPFIQRFHRIWHRLRVILFWPGTLVEFLSKSKRLQDTEKQREWNRTLQLRWVFRLIVIVVGTILFFLGAVAETRLDL